MRGDGCPSLGVLSAADFATTSLRPPGTQLQIKNLRGELSPKNVSLEYHLGDIL